MSGRQIWRKISHTLDGKETINKFKLKKLKYFFIFLLVMPKYEGKPNFSFLSIPEVGEKQ